ncbi:MAG: DNA repair protein RecO [Firmicutes bacterium]|nr:DNA repair protein RecO [Bacillota bacterium]
MTKLYKVDAVVLRARDCGNADKLLTLFSRERGKIKVMAHGAGRTNSRKRGSVQPFTRSRFLLRRGRELDSVSQCEGLDMHLHLREDLTRLACASYLAELVEALAPEDEPNEPLFILLAATLQLMAGGDPETLALCFAMKAAALSGYFPELEVCAVCRAALGGNIYFSPDLGGVVCPACREGAPGKVATLNRGLIETMKALARWHPARLHQLKVDSPVKEKLRELLREFFRYHLEKDLKTADFLMRLE